MGKVTIKYLAAGSLGSIVKGRVQKVRQDISIRIANLWRERVSQAHLSERAKNRYSKAIKPYTAPRTGAYIEDAVARLLEKGWKAFDMKPGLLAGNKSRVIPMPGGLRTVSINSPKSSWRHPGFKGAHLESRVRQSIQRLVREALSDET